MTSIELAICIILVLISGFLSSSEIALFSLSRFQLRALKDHLRPSVHRKIKALLADPGGLLISILFVNEIVNVAITAVITHAISKNSITQRVDIGPIPGWAIESLLGTLITAPIVLFLCEITPKVVGARANQLVAGLSITPLGLTYRLLLPVRATLKKVVNALGHWSGGGSTAEGTEGILKESDFMLLIEEGHKEGAIHESELGLIKKVFELDNTTVEEILKPISQVQTISAQAPLKNALQLIRTQNFSRIPVLSPSKKIVGILYSKDLLRARMNPEHLLDPVSSVMRRPISVHPGMRLNALFRKFKLERTHMAIVQNNAAEILGVVTMADVLEAVFEDLLTDDGEGDESPKAHP